MDIVQQNKIIEKTYGIDIKSLQMSVRLFNCLKRAGYNLLTDVMLANPDDFLKIRNFGKTSEDELNSIREFVIKSDRGTILDSCIGHAQIQAFSGGSDLEWETYPTVVENVVLRHVKPDELVFVKDGQCCEDVETSSFPFSIRTQNALQRNNLFTFKQIAFLPITEFTDIKGLGTKSRNEVFEAISNTVIIKESREVINKVSESLLGDVYSFYSQIIDKELLDSNKNEIEYSVSSYCWKNHITSFDSIKKVNLSKFEPFNRLLRHTILTNLSDVLYLGIEKDNLVRLISNNNISFYQIIEDVVSQMLEDKQAREFNGNIYKYKLFLSEWIDSLKDNYREVVKNRCDGLTLEEIGYHLGVTRERVRQIAVKAFRRKPELYEDGYKRFIEQYAFSRDEFQRLLGLNALQTNYLLLNYEHGNRSLQSFVDDTTVPKCLKDRVQYAFEGKIVLINGQCIPLRRDKLLKKVLQDNFSGYESGIEQFAEYYLGFLRENKIDQYEDLQFPNRRALEARISDAYYTIGKIGKKIRYYDTSLIDINKLLAEVDINRYNNMEISTLLIFNDYPDVMDRYDIRDEYELHNLIRKRSADIINCHITVTRMPFLTIGDADRNRQVENLLIKMAPVKNDILAKEYESKYGVKAETVLANFFKCIDVFYHDGVFDLEQQDLDRTEFDALKERLSEDIYLWDSIIEIYQSISSNPNYEAINSMTLKKLGFKIYSQYVIKSTYGSSDEFFYYYLTKDEILDFEKTQQGIKNLPACYSTLNQLRDNLDLIEVDKDVYYRYDRFSMEYGIDTKAELRSIGAEILDKYQTDYISASVIANDKDVTNDRIYLYNPFVVNSLLRNQPGIKTTKIVGVYIATGIEKDLSLSGIVVSFVKDNSTITISELLHELDNKYCIRTNKTKVFNVVNNSESLIYNDLTDEVKYNNSEENIDVADVTFLKEIACVSDKHAAIAKSTSMIAKVYWKDKFGSFVEYCGLQGLFEMRELLDLNLKDFYNSSNAYSLTRNTITEIVSTYVDWANSIETKHNSDNSEENPDNNEVKGIMDLFFK